MGLSGHVIAVIHHKGKHVPLDPSIGRVFFKKDNKDLASIEDIIKDKGLIERVVNSYSRFFDTKRLFFYGYCKIIWPEGASEE